MSHLFRWTVLLCGCAAAFAAPLRIATFQADVTPPLGTALCCDGRIKPALRIAGRLTARGIVLLGNAEPVVLVAVDWVGIGNEGYDAWRQALAAAAKTQVERVAVHTIHVHDAPSDDWTAERLLEPFQLAGAEGDRAFIRESVTRTAAALRDALRRPQAVTEVRFGAAPVERVASNRRIIGPDGKLQFGRMSSCRNSPLCHEPEGTIDPLVRSVSFWNGTRPLAVLTTYACHPQSYYGKGEVSADFVGEARALREAELPQVALIHFDGAGGNIAAGKYNDGSVPMRAELARRLAAGMKAAYLSAKPVKLTAADLDWRATAVALPVAEALRDRERLRGVLTNSSTPLLERLSASRDLAWSELCAQGRKIALARLRLGDAQMLFVPGELFVEYQLAAQQMHHEKFIAMAAYGDYGPGYIGTAAAYPEGGYETGAASRTTGGAERILLDAIRALLHE